MSVEPIKVQTDVKQIKVLDLSSNELIRYMKEINPCLAGTIVSASILYCYDLDIDVQPIKDLPNTLLNEVYTIFSSYFYTGNDVDKENFYYKSDEDKFRSGIHFIIWKAYLHFFIHYFDSKVIDIIDYLHDAITICDKVTEDWNYNCWFKVIIEQIIQYRNDNEEDNIVYIKNHDDTIKKLILY